MQTLTRTLPDMEARDPERGKRLRAFRERKMLSQEDVARRIAEHRPDGRHVTAKTVWNWEAGSGIHPENMRALAALYGVSADEIQGAEIPNPFRIADHIDQRLEEFHQAFESVREHMGVQDAERAELTKLVQEAIAAQSKRIGTVEAQLEVLLRSAEGESALEADSPPRAGGSSGGSRSNRRLGRDRRAQAG